MIISELWAQITCFHKKARHRHCWRMLKPVYAFVNYEKSVTDLTSENVFFFKISADCVQTAHFGLLRKLRLNCFLLHPNCPLTLVHFKKLHALYKILIITMLTVAFSFFCIIDSSVSVILRIKELRFLTVWNNLKSVF